MLPLVYISCPYGEQNGPFISKFCLAWRICCRSRVFTWVLFTEADNPFYLHSGWFVHLIIQFPYARAHFYTEIQVLQISWAQFWILFENVYHISVCLKYSIRYVRKGGAVFESLLSCEVKQKILVLLFATRIHLKSYFQHFFQFPLLKSYDRLWLESLCYIYFHETSL